ncbi:MAG: DUF350 domain-containing protein [Acidobacteriota bacterium]
MTFEAPQIQLISTLIYLLLIFLSVIIAIYGSLILIPFITGKFFMKFSDLRFKKFEIIKSSNIGIALVLSSFIWTIGRMCLETVKPVMNAWYYNYSTGFSFKTALKLIFGILGSLITALIIGAIAIYISIKIIMTLTKGIDEWEEIKKGNTAVAIVLSVTVIVVGMFFESIISSIVINFFNFQ